MRYVVKDALSRVVTGFHRALFSASNGRLGGSIVGMPVLALTTVGRKTGKPRTTMLSAPIEEGGTIVLVASNGGDDRHPTWLLNLRSNPDVEVKIDGRTRKMRARVADPEEKARLWPRVTGKYRGYALYQRNTKRDIPLVILEPI